MPYVPACHSSRRTISSSASSRPSPIASAVRRAIRAICARVCSTVADPSMPRTRARPLLHGEAGDHPRLRRARDRADDDRVEEDAELALLLRDLVRPAGEAEPAERMVGRAGRDRVRLAARLLDRSASASCQLGRNADVEAGVDEADVGAHDPREQDVADLVVDGVGPVDPVLLHEHAAQPELRGDGGDLPRVVRLHAADRDERVAALCERVGGEVLELAHLVAAVGEARVAVLALRPDLDLPAEVRARAAGSRWTGEGPKSSGTYGWSASVMRVGVWRPGQDGCTWVSPSASFSPQSGSSWRSRCIRLGRTRST